MALSGPVTLTFDLSTSKWVHGLSVTLASFLPTVIIIIIIIIIFFIRN